MNKAVIFDMDGVLVDSYQAHFESWKRLARENGLKITEQQFAETFGRTSREIIPYLWPGAARIEDIPKWDARKEALYRQILSERFPAMDGVNELLTSLHHDGYKLAVGSSGPAGNVRLVIEKLSAGEFFDARVDGSEVSRGKPDPGIFLLAARKLGVEPGHCAVVEDAPVGIEAALSAGMAAIALTGTTGRGQLARADLVVDSLRELDPGLINKLILAHRKS